MIGLHEVYDLAGLMFAAYAVLGVLGAGQRRWKNSAFWALLALSFLAGDALGDFGNGLLVLALVLLASLGGLKPPTSANTSDAQRLSSARRWGDRLFVPALMLPLVTVLGTILFKKLAAAGHPIVDPAQATLVSLALAVIVSLSIALPLLRQPWASPLQEGRRLIDSVGWAAVLPQMLAALGAVFAMAGVGQVVGDLASRAMPADSRLAAVVAYTLGMAAFTLVMGNAFAAFPVMTAGIGLPLIVQRFGGDPAIMAAIGMLSGFCGTLMTPMAANFNLVPAALLELPDRNAVIKAQLPTALLLLAFNTVAMYVLVWR
ncbi:MAG: rane protein [Hydrocarboniphaga sp.]|uniref:DUF979 domain-containing protein n=1 Tax=Hydrocarboniphaga sp. TaxID=2033016 RepID=UPI002622ABF3|nr:DUF979 domain-containing protein [Hydrocarboniphaga sp.]MDB5972979.1 rane protein [Hydrocarboniphaga sp.]